MRKKDEWYYEHANFFEVLNHEQQHRLVGLSKAVHFKKGQLMCSIGDLCEHTYIVRRGIIKVFLLSPDGKETILAIRQPGNIISVTPIFGWPRRVSYVAALSEVDVLKIRVEDIRNMILSDIRLAEFIIKMLCARLHHSRRLIHDLSTKDVRDRLISLLLDLLKECGVEKDGDIVINIELTHEQLSQMIATSRQSVTTILNDLESQGIIQSIQKRISVREPDSLVRLLEGGDSL